VKVFIGLVGTLAYLGIGMAVIGAVDRFGRRDEDFDTPITLGVFVLIWPMVLIVLLGLGILIAFGNVCARIGRR
jgi:hypothetical protein